MPNKKFQGNLDDPTQDFFGNPIAELTPEEEAEIEARMDEKEKFFNEHPELIPDL